MLCPLHILLSIALALAPVPGDPSESTQEVATNADPDLDADPEDLDADLEDLDADPEDLDTDPEDFDEDPDEDLHEEAAPADGGEPTSDPVSPRECRRSDFADFDAYVECQVAVEGVTASGANAAPSVDPKAAAEAEKRTELAEAVSTMESQRPGSSRGAAAREERERRRRVALGLGIGGGVAVLGGSVSMITAFVLGTKTSDPPSDGGPVCTIGKRCGNACIEVSDTCHVGTGGGSTTTPQPVALWTGVLLLAAGAALLASAWVIRSRTPQPRSLQVRAVGPTGVTLAF